MQDVLSADFCSDDANSATKVFGISQMDGIGKTAERNPDAAFPIAEDERLLCVGATIANEIRRTIFQELQYTCSTGIATNKLLAKLASPLNKPDGQTVREFAFASYDS
jgi:DNA polymerase eta